MWAMHTLFKLPGFNCSFTTSEIYSYTTSWKPYYKNPGYPPDVVVIKASFALKKLTN